MHLAHSALFKTVDRELKQQEGFTTAHQVILFVLGQEDGLSFKTVAKRTGHGKTRLTGLVNTLERKGMLSRHASEEDGRIQQLFISKKGTDFIRKSTLRVKELNEELLAPFDGTERQTIGRFLNHVVAKYDVAEKSD